MNTTSNVTPISDRPKQPQQRQTFQDIIAANLKNPFKHFEAGRSDATNRLSIFLRPHDCDIN